MTATINGSSQHDVLNALVRSDNRWATRTHDEPAPDGYLKHLAAALEPVVQAAASVDLDAFAKAGAELEQVCADNAALADEIAALRRQVGQLRADYATLSGERAELAAANARLTAETGPLRRAVEEHAAAAQRHVCQWDWSDPTKPIQPCEGCGRPWPRYVEYEAEEIEPDVEPWESLFGRLRAELPGWGDSVRPRPGAAA